VNAGIDDKWVWKHDLAAGFSVNSAYKLLQKCCSHVHVSAELGNV